MSTFYEVLTEAVADIVEHGFDSQKRIDGWLVKIRQAAIGSLIPQHKLELMVRKNFVDIYQRMVVKGGILKHHKGLSQFTLDMVKPKLRNELDRHIMANAKLITLNREAAVETTLRRFAGWSTSIPSGGTKAADKLTTKTAVRKSLAQLPFQERRVAIDQGHKFISSLNRVLAVEHGALAGIWHSHWRRKGYNYRPDHKERDLKVYAVRGNWAFEKGLMKVGPDGYTDQITQPAEEVYCECFYQYVYNIQDLPEYMLTAKAKRAIMKVETV